MIAVVQEVRNDYKSLKYKSCTFYIYTGEKLGSSKQGASQTGKLPQKKKTQTLSIDLHHTTPNGNST